MESILEEKKKLGLLPSKYEIKHDDNGKPIFHILFVLADLTLSPKSTIIETEKSIIRERYEKLIDEYPPEVLRVGEEEYTIKLYDAECLLAFSL